MGFFSDSLKKFHKHFSKKYPELYKKYVDSDALKKEELYKVPFESPEVIPSIADAMHQALNIYIAKLNNSNNLLNAINSNLTANFFSKKNVFVLFVVQENERNIFDQRAIETELYDKQYLNIFYFFIHKNFFIKVKFTCCDTHCGKLMKKLSLIRMVN